MAHPRSSWIHRAVWIVAVGANALGLGNGLLQDHGPSWARVQWQGRNGGAPPIDPSVPATVQGVGEVTR